MRYDIAAANIDFQRDATAVTQAVRPLVSNFPRNRLLVSISSAFSDAKAMITFLEVVSVRLGGSRWLFSFVIYRAMIMKTSFYFLLPAALGETAPSD